MRVPPLREDEHLAVRAGGGLDGVCQDHKGAGGALFSYISRKQQPSLQANGSRDAQLVLESVVQVSNGLLWEHVCLHRGRPWIEFSLIYSHFV